MSYLGEYDRLEAAFINNPNTEPAVFGDIFRPSDEFPNMGIPIGWKIEKETSLGVAIDVAQVAVAVNCRVILLEPELFEGNITPDVFSLWTCTPDPAMVMRQEISWKEGADHHSTRAVNSLQRKYMKNVDDDQAAYVEEVRTWRENNGDMTPFNEDDYPHTPLGFTYVLASDYSVFTPPEHSDKDIDVMIRGLARNEAFDNHWKGIETIAEQFEPVEHLVNHLGNCYADQTAAQLTAHNDWLLGA